MGISMFSSPGSSLSAPSFVRQSLSLLPMLPLWPFVHWKVVGAVLLFSVYAAFLNSFLFLMPIHPLSSHSLRWVVRLLIVYLESVMILRGQLAWTASAAMMTAAISPAWFD